MIKKEFMITDRHIELIKDMSKKLGISLNESLRRILDSYIDKKSLGI